MLFEVIGKGQSAECNLKHDKNRHKLNDRTIRAKQQQPVERACQIIGIQGQKVCSKTNVIAVGKASACP